jgi:hypothetical protein
MIQVCVLVEDSHNIKRCEREFKTRRNDLKTAKKWATDTAGRNSCPLIEPEPLRYTIESTSTYHIPVLKAFGGRPSAADPQIAGQSMRKTDVPDARALARHSLVDLWKATYVASNEMSAFRLVIRQIEHHTRSAGSLSSQINNCLLRFGHTIGSAGSAARGCRDIATGMRQDGCEYDHNVQFMVGGKCICPEGLPETAKGIILSMYEQHGDHIDQAAELTRRALEIAGGMEWETRHGCAKGAELVANLLSVPHAGPKTVLIWLSGIMTPRRFASSAKPASCCGCDPSLKVSAGKAASHTKRKGNAKLHSALAGIASSCVGRGNDALGKRGKKTAGSHAKGGCKKACGAVARRIAVAMHHVHSSNMPFSYGSCNFFVVKARDVPVQEMGLSNRAANALMKNRITTGQMVPGCYAKGVLRRMKGIGKKSLDGISAWMDSNVEGSGAEWAKRVAMACSYLELRRNAPKRCSPMAKRSLPHI